MSDILQRFNDSNEEIISTTEKYLTFLIDSQHYAIPIINVQGIIAMEKVTQVPEFPSYVKGIINVRGAITPLIDIRIRFHKPEKEYDERTSVITVNINNMQVGFIVDMVDEVLDIDNIDISPPLNMSSEINSRYITGIGKINGKIILLLDSTKILSEKELSSIANAI